MKFSQNLLHAKMTKITITYFETLWQTSLLKIKNHCWKMPVKWTDYIHSSVKKNYSDGSIFSARAAELIDSRPNSALVILEEAR